MNDFDHSYRIQISPRIPLLPCAVALIAGIILAQYLPLSKSQLFLQIALASLIFSAVFLYIRDKKGKQFLNRPIQILLIITFVCLGGLRCRQFLTFPKDHILTFCDQNEPRLASLRGTIDSEPYIRKSVGFFAPSLSFPTPATVFELNCTEILSNSGWRGVSGLCHVVLRQPALHLKQGQLIELHGSIRPRPRPTNPGQANPQQYYLSQKNLVLCSVNHTEAVTILSEKPPFTTHLKIAINKLRRHGRAALLAGLEPQEEQNPEKDSTAFLSALVLGLRHELDPWTYETFLRTGTVHFLSVSGFHVGLAGLFAWILAGFLPLPRPLRAALTLLIVVLYVLLIPARPPVLRAAVLTASFCLALMTRRTTLSLNTLALAGILILAFRPLDLFNPGFQLSFLIVIALMIFLPLANLYAINRLSTNLKRATRDIIQPSPIRTIFRNLRIKFFHALWIITATSIIAWLISLPLCAFHFNRVALWAILGSILLWPLIGLLMILSLTKIILSLLLPALAVTLAGALQILAQWALSLTETLSALPASNFNIPSPPLWLMIAYFALWLSIAHTTHFRQKLPRLRVLTVLLLLPIVLLARPVSNSLSQKNQIRMDLLDIGRGTTCLLQFPNGKTLVYDAGSTSDLNLASHTLLPLLRSRGINTIDALFISHPNLDHYCGVPDLCRFMTVRSIYLNDHFISQADRTAKRFIDDLNQQNQPIQTLSAKEYIIPEIHPDAALEILWPGPYDPGIPLSANDTSTVLRIVTPYGVILLCGDMGTFPQQQLLDSLPAEKLKADILLLPHHGSLNSLLPSFVEAVDPQFCLNSSARLADDHHQNLIQQCGNRTIYHTWRHGCISLYLRPTGIRTQLFKP